MILTRFQNVDESMEWVGEATGYELEQVPRKQETVVLEGRYWRVTAVHWLISGQQLAPGTRQAVVFVQERND